MNAVYGNVRTQRLLSLNASKVDNAKVDDVGPYTCTILKPIFNFSRHTKPLASLVTLSSDPLPAEKVLLFPDACSLCWLKLLVEAVLLFPPSG